VVPRRQITLWRCDSKVILLGSWDDPKTDILQLEKNKDNTNQNYLLFKCLRHVTHISVVMVSASRQPPNCPPQRLQDSSPLTTPITFFNTSLVSWQTSSGHTHTMADTHQKGLCENLYNIFKSGKYSDLTICSDDREFKVHQAVVCPQCRFFAAACDGAFQVDIMCAVVVPN
jgi:hypothetical protein